MTSNPEVYERTHRTTVHLKRGFLTPGDLVLEHRGPADFKLDKEGNLRVEVYPENSDFEVVIALVLADTFYAVTQVEVEDESCIVDEEEDEDCPCDDCGDGSAPDDEDREIQVHDPEADEF